jgi:signal transduction histidine kinase
MRVNLVSRTGTAALCAAAIAMCAVTGALAVSGSSSQYAWLEAVARVLTVAVPIAVGLFALHRPPFERFGALLVISGCVWFLTTLAYAEDATLYSIGRVSQWLFEPVLIYLLLAFPTGRLGSRLDRALVWIPALLVVFLYLPTALLVEDYPLPAVVTSCEVGCPGNAFIVTGSEPALVDAVVLPLREILTVALFAAVTVRLAQRLRSATRLRRRALAPVLVVAGFRCGAFAGALLGRRLAPESDVIVVSLWLLALAVPLTAVAFLVGLVRWWVFIAHSTQRLSAKIDAHTTPDDLVAALAEAFDDPSLAVVYRLEDGEGPWADAHGQPLDLAAFASVRAVTKIVDGDREVAAIVHDAALEDDRAFIDAATSYVLVTLENHRLVAQTSSLLRAVRNSQARIKAAADDERRRIERDLHDGAQQQLVALRIKIELAAERTGDGRGNGVEGATLLRKLGVDLEHALDEVRSLARGVYPASLSEGGLIEGLRTAARRNPLPTTVLASRIRRHPPDVENAAYFCCLEALQNAAKHAKGATAAVIELWDEDPLRLEVRDDGAGFDPDTVAAGAGFITMRERLAAVGGVLAIRSSAGCGTRVSASIPVRAEQR